MFVSVEYLFLLFVDLCLCCVIISTDYLLFVLPHCILMCSAYVLTHATMVHNYIHCLFIICYYVLPHCILMSAARLSVMVCGTLIDYLLSMFTRLSFAAFPRAFPRAVY